VGITRAQERLFLSHARERRLYGSREPASPSTFLAELPKELLVSNTTMAIPSGTKLTAGVSARGTNRFPDACDQTRDTSQADWVVGDRLVHQSFGVGQVTHIFGAGSKICLAVKFPGQGQKIIDPKVTSLQRVE
ncbi:MAG TPA: hypothetical protein V6D03_04805, partial [Candidatus Caenarcaniphilales bacterium]